MTHIGTRQYDLAPNPGTVALIQSVTSNTGILVSGDEFSVCYFLVYYSGC